MANTVVVWGNCQAEPIARLLAEPLAGHGLEVVPVPPVFLIDAAGLARVHEILRTAAVLVTQPVRDEYRIPGCGANQLRQLVPDAARVVTVPVVFHTGPFPYQVNAHGADGGRVDAPLTDYHDLRALVAAERDLTLERALSWWPAPEAAAVQQTASESLAELQRREAGLDVAASDLLDRPDALFTITHPRNAVLAELARRVLAVLDLADPVLVPEREFLGQRRAPVERAVVEASGWPADSVEPDWQIDNRPVQLAEVLAAHLELYRQRPDVVADARVRYADRLRLLGL